MAKGHYLFVYGTLRREFNDSMRHLLTRSTTFVCTGIFHGKLFDLGRYPGAVESRGKNDRVRGEIYKLTNEKELFEALDQYEGPEFQRKRATISLAGGARLSCWIYLYKESTTRHTFISSGDYVAYRNTR